MYMILKALQTALQKKHSVISVFREDKLTDCLLTPLHMHVKMTSDWISLLSELQFYAPFIIPLENQKV